MPAPRNPTLKAAYDKLNTASTSGNILSPVPTWAQLIIQAGLLLIDYLAARDELQM